MTKTRNATDALEEAVFEMGQAAAHLYSVTLLLREAQEMEADESLMMTESDIEVLKSKLLKTETSLRRKFGIVGSGTPIRLARILHDHMPSHMLPATDDNN